MKAEGQRRHGTPHPVQQPHPGWQTLPRLPEGPTEMALDVENRNDHGTTFDAIAIVGLGGGHPGQRYIPTILASII